MVPYAVKRLSDDRLVGMTSYYELQAELPRLKIGYTWISASSQGSLINTEMKLLMLRHAFDELGVVAVGFDAHALNAQSRAAILKLGAKLDGVIRADRLRGGVIADTASYSIIASEWPAVQQLLEHRLRR